MYVALAETTKALVKTPRLIEEIGTSWVRARA